MKDRLSALMDGELPEEEFDVLVPRVGADAELRGAWDAYHLVGDALRGYFGADLAAGVARRLREEPTVLAPRPSSRQGAGRVAWYAMSAAAGLLAVALVVWTALPLVRPQPQLTADAAASAPIVPVAASTAAPAAEPKPRVATAEVENYLLAHQLYSHTSAMQGVAPWVRTVAEGRDGGDR
jgi:sigma-E factor negative regulatory protein RseA